MQKNYLLANWVWIEPFPWISHLLLFFFYFPSCSPPNSLMILILFIFRCFSGYTEIIYSGRSDRTQIPSKALKKFVDQCLHFFGAIFRWSEFQISEFTIQPWFFAWFHPDSDFWIFLWKDFDIRFSNLSLVRLILIIAIWHFFVTLMNYTTYSWRFEESSFLLFHVRVRN